MDRRPDRLTPAKHPHDVPDADLLRRYAASGSPDAFAALVDRYLPLIYSAALRQTRDPHLAEDAAQATLIILSQKAGRVDPTTLPGWLLKAAHYAARNAVRQCVRRTRHERRAAAMRAESHSPADPDPLSRAIDPALARLGEADRTAIVLRYFQDMSFADIAARLRTTESAAQRRVARAVEKLRAILARQGVGVVPAAFPAALCSQVPHPVPSSLSTRATSSGVSKSVSTHLISKGALYAMAAAKVKTAAAIAAVLLVGAAIPTAYHFTAANRDFIPDPPAPATAPFMRPVSGSLAPGMEVEPFAVMRLADKKWFGPDGRERTDVPAPVSELAAGRTAPGATHAFCYRMGTSRPTTSTGWIGTFRGATADNMGSYRDPVTRDYYFVAALTPDPGSPSVTLTIHVTDRPDATVAVIPASATAPVQAAIEGLPLTAGPPVERGRQARLPMQIDFDTVYRAVYMVDAIDTAGKRVHGLRINIFDRRSREDVFGGPLSSYREFRVLSRPYNYHATFAPVPLPQAK